MGEELGKMLTGNLILIDKEGNQTELKNVIIDEINAEPNVIEEDDTLTNFRKSTVTNVNYTANIKIENITRKKFIKMLMAKGIARNGAKDIADYIHKKYGSYSPVHLLFL